MDLMDRLAFMKTALVAAVSPKLVADALYRSPAAPVEAVSGFSIASVASAPNYFRVGDVLRNTKTQEKLRVTSVMQNGFQWTID